MLIYLRLYGQKQIFSKWSQNNDLFLKMLTKNDLMLSKCWYLRRFFQNDLKITIFSSKYCQKIANIMFYPEMLICITEIWIKHDFFKMIAKERNFPWNIDIYGYMNIFFSKCRYFQIYLLMAKNNFFKVITKNVIFLEMLVFSEIWTKHVFFKMISKNVVFVDILTFSNIWAQTDFSKKGLFLETLMRLYWQTTTYSIWCQNNVIFLLILIFENLWIKNYFFKMISK